VVNYCALTQSLLRVGVATPPVSMRAGSKSDLTTAPPAGDPKIQSDTQKSRCDESAIGYQVDVPNIPRHWRIPCGPSPQCPWLGPFLWARVKRLIYVPIGAFSNSGLISAPRWPHTWQMNLGSKSDRRTLSLQQPARAAERSHFPESDLLLALHLHMKARTNRSCKLSIPWGLELSRDASSCGTRGTDQDGLQLLRAYIASISKAWSGAFSLLRRLAWLQAFQSAAARRSAWRLIQLR